MRKRAVRQRALSLPNWSVIVSGGSPRPAHGVTRSHCYLRADRSRRIVAFRSPHRAMPSVVVSPMLLDCSARLRSLLYDYQGFKEEIVTTIGWYDLLTSTTLASTKSHQVMKEGREP